MTIKNSHEIKLMQHGGHILSEILDQLKKYTKPGIRTIDIEQRASILLDKYKVTSPFKNFHAYPANTCISINDEVVHGIPSSRIIRDKDIVSIDCGVRYKGYCTDSAITFGVGNISKNNEKLIITTQKSLLESIKLIKPGEYLGTIQAKIQQIIEKQNYGLIRDLTGHGIGKELQEDPQIPNYGQKKSGIILQEGMTFCLEPMVTLGTEEIVLEKDGWTITTADNSIAAHFEHTIAVTKSGSQILTK